MLYLGVSCGDPGLLTNGDRFTEGHLYRDNVYYWCNYGYNISSGNENRTCQADQTWSGTSPNCTSK